VVVLALAAVGALGKKDTPGIAGTTTQPGGGDAGARTARLNTPATIEGVEVTVAEASYRESIDEYQKPAAGYVFVAFKLRLTAIDAAKFVSANDWSVLADGTRQGKWTVVISDQWEPILSLEEVRPGATTEGWVVFEVPRPTSFVRLVYDPSFFSSDARLTLDVTCCK
jgi:hypothetical protein